VRADDAISLLTKPKFVSRGGLKLDHALSAFSLNVQECCAVDMGSSTGGFTDCLLQAGARQVYSVDVGTGQLAWKLRQDPRVVVMEKTNARFLTPASFRAPFELVDFVAIDCSFISLKKLLHAANTLLRTGGNIVALIKPQFEAGKAEADKGQGVIRNSAIHERIIQELSAFVSDQLNLEWSNVIESPIVGPAGNKEFLVLIEKT
jgi:23S rRNA (cytidine1920-2'-O)/16S rRNA (cytidine1409-2'-O)-methyltransferase